MKKFTLFAVTAVAAVCFAIAVPRAQAQVSLSVNIGPQPICPYGYFDYAPYPCAPFGYYGPEWFVNGVFIGAGPWFHGPENFHGHVNERFDPHHGYKGALPHRNERADWGKHSGWDKHFKGNAVREEHPHHDNGHDKH